MRNKREVGETWINKKFALLPVQLGDFGRMGELLVATERIWLETYFVEYQLEAGLLYTFKRVIRKWKM